MSDKQKDLLGFALCLVEALLEQNEKLDPAVQGQALLDNMRLYRDGLKAGLATLYDDDETIPTPISKQQRVKERLKATIAAFDSRYQTNKE